MPRAHGCRTTVNVNSAEDIVEDGLVVRVGVEGRRGEGHQARQHLGVVLEEPDPPAHLLEHQLRRAARSRIEEPGVDERVVLVGIRAGVRVRFGITVRVRVWNASGLSCCTTSDALVAATISCSAGKGSWTQTVSVSACSTEKPSRSSSAT